MNFRRIAVAGIAALAVAAGVGLTAQGAAPGAPGNLTYQVNGGSVFLNWISSPGMNPTFDPNSSFYRLEAAAAPGAPRSSRGTAPSRATLRSRARCSTCCTEFATAVWRRATTTCGARREQRRRRRPVQRGAGAGHRRLPDAGRAHGLHRNHTGRHGVHGLERRQRRHCPPATSCMRAISRADPSSPPSPRAGLRAAIQGGYLNVGGCRLAPTTCRSWRPMPAAPAPTRTRSSSARPTTVRAVRTPNAASGKLPWF